MWGGGIKNEDLHEWKNVLQQTEEEKTWLSFEKQFTCGRHTVDWLGVGHKFIFCRSIWIIKNHLVF